MWKRCSRVQFNCERKNHKHVWKHLIVNYLINEFENHQVNHKISSNIKLQWSFLSGLKQVLWVHSSLPLLKWICRFPEERKLLTVKFSTEREFSLNSLFAWKMHFLPSFSSDKLIALSHFPHSLLLQLIA